MGENMEGRSLKFPISLLLVLLALPVEAKTIKKSRDEVIVEVNGVQMGYRERGGKRFILKQERVAPGQAKKLVEREIGPMPAEREPLDSPGGASVTLLTAPADTAIVIDVLVLYSDSAAAALGGADQMPAFAELACAVSTQTAANSGSPNISYRCLGPRRVSYQESSGTNPLSWMLGNAEVTGPEVALGADLVHLITTNNACGQGYLTSSLGTNYSQSDQSCTVGNLTFPHETGHNIGMQHDPASVGWCTAISPTSGLLYCTGWYNTGHAWPIGAVQERSVMAYPGAGGTRVMQFSNPAVLRLGVPTGIAGERDNARVLRERAYTVSQFRQPVTTPTLPPSTPLRAKVNP